MLGFLAPVGAAQGMGGIVHCGPTNQGEKYPGQPVRWSPWHRASTGHAFLMEQFPILPWAWAQRGWNPTCPGG